MKQIPNYILSEITTICKVFSEKHPPSSLKHINAIRRAVLLHRKLEKLNNGKPESKTR